MNRRTSFALAFLAAAAVAVACSNSGKGLNFGCGPDDPCCAKGSWTYTCQPSPACGTCPADTAPSHFGPLVIDGGVARDGGMAYRADIDAGRLFDVTTCSIVRPPGGSCDLGSTYYFGSGGPSYQYTNACGTSTACEKVCDIQICTPDIP